MNRGTEVDSRRVMSHCCLSRWATEERSRLSVGELCYGGSGRVIERGHHMHSARVCRNLGAAERRRCASSLGRGRRDRVETRGRSGDGSWRLGRLGARASSGGGSEGVRSADARVEAAEGMRRLEKIAEDGSRHEQDGGSAGRGAWALGQGRRGRIETTTPCVSEALESRRVRLEER